MTISVRNSRTPAGGATRGRATKLGAGILVLLGLCLGFIGLAPNAGAHHPSLTASVDCATTPGQYTVHYTSTTWDTVGSGGLNADIRVLYGPASIVWPASAATVANLPANSIQAATGAYADTADPATDRTFSGTFVVTGSQGDQIDVIAWAAGAWGNGNTGHELRGADASANGTPVTLTLPGDCPVKDLDLDATQVCATGGGVDVTVKNNGNVPGELTIAWTQSPGTSGSTSTGSLAAGASVTKNIPILENSTYSLTFTGDKGDDGLPANISNQTRNCQSAPAPAASVDWECGDANAVVHFTNGGQEAVTADIYKGASLLFDDASPGDFNVPITAGDENTEVTITLDFSDSTANFVQKINVDCQSAPNPAASVDWECGDANAVVHFTNGGQEAVTADISKGASLLFNDASPGDFNVPIVAGDENSTVTITVDFSDSTATFTEEIVVDCLQPVAAVQFSCAEGGVLVRLSNLGKLAVLVHVGNEDVNVPAGTTAEDPIERTIPVAEGDAYDITILGETASGTRDCEEPEAASIELDCAEGGVVVTLVNNGELPAVVKVNGENVIVPAADGDTPGTTSVTVPVEEGANYDFDVVIEGVTTDVTGTRDCEEAGLLSAELDCAEGGVVVLLTNTGESDATVTVNGLEVVVPAGTTADDPFSILIPVDEDDAYDFAVTGDGIDEQVSGTRDCETVEGNVVTPAAPTALPTTGADTIGFLALSAFCLISGAALYISARRREARLS